MEIPGPLPIVGSPPLSYRFSVVFFVAGVAPNPIDILFQKVSGIHATVKTDPIEEGGQNLYTQQVPIKIEYDNLLLERGLVTPSPLDIEFNIAMSIFKFSPSNVLVTLLDNTYLPITSWLFMKAFPVKWSFSDLDADANSVFIETMELAYQRMQTIKV